MPNIDFDVVANTSYAILLVSYLMRDILWLRVLTVISLGFEIPYFYFRQAPLWDGIGWDVAFIAINVYWIARLVFDRRPVRFTAEQKRLWETALHRLHPRHARVLFKRGTPRAIAPNEIVLKQGDMSDELLLIAEGKVELRIHEEKVEELGPGHFIGSASFLERDLDFPMVTTIVAIEPTRVITWKEKELRALIDGDNQLSTAIEATLGLEIADLLKRAWSREASPDWRSGAAHV